MIDPGWSAAIASASVLIGDQVNRRLFGWLPDDPPRAGRKSHARPMTLAGVLVAPAILIYCALGKLWLLAVAVAVVAEIGFEDDRRKERADPLGESGLDWRWKALGLVTAAALVACEVADPVTDPWRWSALLALTFVITNAVNFLDNTDGVAACLSAALLLLLGFGALPPGPYQSVSLAAGFAALGFLPFNWPKPRVFLGDSGAYALGICASFAVAAAALKEPKWLLAATVPLADFTQVVLMRLWLGIPPWVGDRRHLTHIAQNLGLHRVAVAPAFAALAAGAALISWAI